MNYIIDQIQAHQLVIALFEQEAADGNDADLQGFARRTLPRLEFQLLSLKSLQAAGNADVEQHPSRTLGVLVFET
jgi:putative membrane protein